MLPPVRDWPSHWKAWRVPSPPVHRMRPKACAVFVKSAQRITKGNDLCWRTVLNSCFYLRTLYRRRTPMDQQCNAMTLPGSPPEAIRSPQRAVTRQDLNRVIAASVAGSAMEWYDFSIYGTASALIFADLFFTGLDKTAGLLAIFAAYAAGFLARPFGGIFFGRVRDKHGRKVVLVATILLMGISTFLIGLL